MAQSLSAAERETIIRTSDDDELVHIWTAQRAYISTLRKNARVDEVDSGLIGTTEWASFTVSRDSWRVVALKRSVFLSAEERRAAGVRLRESRMEQNESD